MAVAHSCAILSASSAASDQFPANVNAGTPSGTVQVRRASASGAGEMHDAGLEQHRSAMGFVPQDDVLHTDLTVEENIQFQVWRCVNDAASPGAFLA